MAAAILGSRLWISLLNTGGRNCRLSKKQVKNCAPILTESGVISLKKLKAERRYCIWVFPILKWRCFSERRVWQSILLNSLFSPSMVSGSLVLI